MSASTRLSGRTALVTGAARGVGRATARKLASEGAFVFLNDLDADELEVAAQEVGGVALAGDLTDTAVPDRLVASAVEHRGALDIVVNNAGYIWNSALHNHSDAQWEAMLDIHVTAPFRILRAYGTERRKTPQTRSISSARANPISSPGRSWSPAAVCGCSASSRIERSIRSTLMKIGYKALIENAEKEIETLDQAAAAKLLNDPNVVFVDLRDPRELSREGKIPGAFHAPRGMLEFWVDPDSPYHKDVFSSGKRLVFYCQSGWRSALATQTVQHMGLENVCHIGGGFHGWKAAGSPVEQVPKKD